MSCKSWTARGLSDVGMEIEWEVVRVADVQGKTGGVLPRRGLGGHLQEPFRGWEWGVSRRTALMEEQVPGLG